MPRIIFSSAVAVCSLLLLAGQAAAQGGGGGGGGGQQQGGGGQQQQGGGGGGQQGGATGGGGGGATGGGGTNIGQGTAQGGVGSDIGAGVLNGSVESGFAIDAQTFVATPGGGDGAVGSSAADILARQQGTGTMTTEQIIQQSGRQTQGARVVRPQQQNPQNRNAQQLLFRVQLRPAPGMARAPVASIQPQITASVQRVAQRRNSTAPEIEFNSRVATLRGAAASAAERSFWESYLRIKPGVSEVVNLMTLEGTAQAISPSSE